LAAKRHKDQYLRAFSLSASAPFGILQYGPMRIPCTLGRSGCRVHKREGDGATPAGVWRLQEVIYRPDRCRRPACRLTVRAMRNDEGWCDAVGDRNYNRRVRLPYRASAERLWRQDNLYDILIVLDFNASPRVQGRGSAIFMHIARCGYRPTEGCVALKPADLKRLLAHVGRRAMLCVRTLG
jgi:L,D-peptidoglycan transpeptidase YkuD (ErfK/YbiS/YcfS/YnhG family)